MCLVNKKAVHAELFKGNSAIFFTAVLELFLPRFQGAFGPLQLLDAESLVLVIFQFLNTFLNLHDLILQQRLTTGLGHGEKFKLGVPHNHGIIIAGGDAGAELFPIRGLKILLGCYQDVGGGI